MGSRTNITDNPTPYSGKGKPIESNFVSASTISALINNDIDHEQRLTGLSFNAKSFGALGDGLTDDTAAIQATVKAASVAGGGVVYLPAGTYLVRPSSSAALTIPSKIHLQGAGREITTLLKSANGLMIDFSGSPGTPVTGANHTAYQGMSELTLHGNAKTGPLVQHYYTHFFFGENVSLVSNADVCMRSVEHWDSRFINYYFGFSGSSTAAKPNLLIQNSAASSGIGYSRGCCNELHFYSADFEGFTSGAISVGLGPGGSGNPNGISFTNTKCESEQTALDTPFVSFDNSCTRIRVASMFVHVGSYGPGYSTPPVGINFVPSDGVLENVWLGCGTTATFRRGIQTCAGNIVSIRDIVGQYNLAPTDAHVAIACAGADGTINCAGISCNIGRVFNLVTGLPAHFNYLQPTAQILAFSGNMVADPLAGETVVVGPLQGAAVISNPANSWPGAKLTFILLQDYVGGRPLHWGSEFRKSGSLSVIPNSRSSISFVYDGNFWVQTALATGLQ